MPTLWIYRFPSERGAAADRDEYTHHESLTGNGSKPWDALEIVHTKAGYVHDLHALVNVYFVVLPTIQIVDRALEAVNALERSGLALLRLHERFMGMLQEASAAAVQSDQESEGMWKRLLGARLFIVEAPTYDLYQEFCSAQPDVLRLLRPTAYLCPSAPLNKLSFTLRLPTHPPPQYHPPHPVLDPSLQTLRPPSPGGCRVPRTLSLVPTTSRAYGLASFFTENLSSSLSPTSEFLALHANIRSQSYDSSLVRHRRLRVSNGGGVFAPSSPPPSSSKGGYEGNRPVERAVESMKGVAGWVEEARRRKEAEEKTHMILERLHEHNVHSSVEFLHSLGTCIVVGSLNVVHHHHILEPVISTVHVRYFGAFLFVGGYVLLVKVCKGPVYRLKQWFALVSFELVDILPEKAIVPHSVRLSSVDYRYELAAASEAENSVWIRAAKGSLKPLEPFTPMFYPPSRSSSPSRLEVVPVSNRVDNCWDIDCAVEEFQTERDSVQRDLGDVQTNVIFVSAHMLSRRKR
ncbi:hypothetical protein M422DRAFT_238648 [Sphaerobolus stellatus SS14]|nr:hypothetical protein M422DRAFT_238648 [Sphaerobolus stellatus SS14]